MKLLMSLVVLKVDDADLSAEITDLWGRDPDAGRAVVALLRDDPRLDFVSAPTMVVSHGEPASLKTVGPDYGLVVDLTARAVEDDRVVLDLNLVDEDGLRLHTFAMVSGRSEQIDVPGLLVFVRAVPVSDEGMDEIRTQETAWKEIVGDVADARPAARRRRAEALLADPR